MSGVLDFLRARIDDDERVAKAAADNGLSWRAVDPFGGEDYDRIEGSGQDDAVGYDMSGSAPIHIARHDPARVLREVEAKRRMVEWASVFGYTKLLEELAHPYSDHPDYGAALSE